MSEYNTEQKKLLLEFLGRNRDKSYTIDGIVEGIKSSFGEHSLGKSTVYRLMTRLVEEKRVQRFAEEGSRRFMYRMIADECCRDHLHLKCLRCGRILHLDHETSNALLKQVRLIKDCSVSEEDTVLMGRCADCSVGGKK